MPAKFCSAACRGANHRQGSATPQQVESLDPLNMQPRLLRTILNSCYSDNGTLIAENHSQQLNQIGGSDSGASLAPRRLALLQAGAGAPE